MSSNRSRSLTIASAATVAAAAWSSVTAAALLYRWSKRRAIKEREEKVAQQGGLLPGTQNVIQALESRAQTTPDRLALEAADGTKTYTWKEYYQQVQDFARALLATQQQQEGTNEQYGIAVHAFNEARWFFSALGALLAQWTVSGIYLTNTYEQAAHVLRTSHVKVLVLESSKLLETTYKNALKEFPSLTIVLLQVEPGKSLPDRVVSYDDFCQKGRDATHVTLPSPQDLKPNATTCLVYTSGTTGNPKAVELSHSSIHAVTAAVHARVPLDQGTRIVSYLPLSHIAAMGIDVFCPIYCGGSVHFADAGALRGTLKDTLVRVRPTLFFGVPRVWEKMATAMQEAAKKNYAKPVSGLVLKSIGTAAKAVGKAFWSYSVPEFVKCGFLLVPFGFFKVLAYRKVRKAVGLDCCPALFTGAAPLSADTLWYFRSLDMPLLEVFGMSESTGAITVCGPNEACRPLGSCGRALPAVNGSGELSISEADGEILWKGDNNMIGYKGLTAATAETLNPTTGNLHTGDVGRIDENGFLFITGRKKDIIITAGGENVAPTPIEQTFMTLLKGFVGHIVLVGDQRKFLTVLLAPTEDGKFPTPEQVEEAIKDYNLNYAKSRAQRVQKAHVVEHPLTVDTEELTPTMKVKRAFVVKKFRKEIESMYAESAKLVGYSSMNIGTLQQSV